MDNKDSDQLKKVTLRGDFQAVKIGDVLPDGWIVGPVSPDTGKPIAIEPVSSAPDGFKTWHQGEDHAANLRRQGHLNVRQPTDSELNALYNEVVNAGYNQNARFDTNSPGHYGSYWSSSEIVQLGVGPVGARVRFFTDGDQHWFHKNDLYSHVRCVRDEPNIVLAADI